MSQQIDFLPENYLEKKAQKRTNIICLVLFVIVTVGVGTAFLVTEQQNRAVQISSQAMNDKMLQAGEALKQLQLLETKKKQMNAKANISKDLIEPVPRSLLLATITNDLPAGMSLLEFSLTTKEIKPKSEPNKTKRQSSRKKNTEKKEDLPPSTYETTIDVIGLALTDTDVANLIANLNESFLFEKITPVYTEEHEIDDQLMRRFKLNIMLDPDARANKDAVELVQKKHITGF